MFSYCFSRVPVASHVVDDELNTYLQKFYVELARPDISKKELFKILIDVEKNYNFKSINEKSNIRDKKILMEEMEDEIIKRFKN